MKLRCKNSIHWCCMWLCGRLVTSAQQQALRRLFCSRSERESVQCKLRSSFRADDACSSLALTHSPKKEQDMTWRHGSFNLSLLCLLWNREQEMCQQTCGRKTMLTFDFAWLCCPSPPPDLPSDVTFRTDWPELSPLSELLINFDKYSATSAGTNFALSTNFSLSRDVTTAWTGDTMSLSILSVSRKHTR